MVLLKLNAILGYGIVAFLLSLWLYPHYIYRLRSIKAGKNIRELDGSGQPATIFASLHAAKKGTPTMGGGLMLLMVACMIIGSFVLQYMGWINNSLFNQKETYLLVFGFFCMGGIGLVDDYMNIQGTGGIQGMSAMGKMIGMTVFAGFMAYWFDVKLGIHFISLTKDLIYILPSRDIYDTTISLMFPLSFLFILFVTHAINITDGLDGLAGGICSMIIAVLAAMTFWAHIYTATAILVIVIAVLVAFLWYNIHPARVFMGDSGAFALGGLLSLVVLYLNMRHIPILAPFICFFMLCSIELMTSFIQLGSKKFFKRKFFAIAPFHHLLEHHGMAEQTIVMRMWLVQGMLIMLGLIVFFYTIG